MLAHVSLNLCTYFLISLKYIQKLRIAKRLLHSTAFAWVISSSTYFSLKLKSQNHFFTIWNSSLQLLIITSSPKTNWSRFWKIISHTGTGDLSPFFLHVTCVQTSAFNKKIILGFKCNLKTWLVYALTVIGTSDDMLNLMYLSISLYYKSILQKEHWKNTF